MGKRKLHDTSFFQCDWTGLPMRSSNCYMPVLYPGGKMMKKGSYCNWESVVAHAHHLAERGGGNVWDVPVEDVLRRVDQLAGAKVIAAPHYTELSHVRGHMTPQQFQAACSEVTADVTVVRINADGSLEQIQVPAWHHKHFKEELDHPYIEPQYFCQTRRKARGDKDVMVIYQSDAHLPPNAYASSLFKMQLYGAVIVCLRSQETCFVPRTRLISMTKAHFDETLVRKRRKMVESALTSSEYTAIKTTMQEALNQFEKSVSSKAKAPAQMSKSRPLPSQSGHRMAQLYHQ